MLHGLLPTDFHIGDISHWFSKSINLWEAEKVLNSNLLQLFLRRLFTPILQKY